MVSLQMLMDYTLAHVVALVTDLPGPEFAARVAATTAAANALNASMAETGSKLAAQKMQIEIKKAFRKALSGQILVVYGGLVAAVGPRSPLVTACFPLGRNVFMKCQDGAVEDHLRVLVAGLGTAGALVPASVLAQATSLLTAWSGVYEAASTAKGTKRTTARARQALRAALEGELFTNLLLLALRFPNDEAKAAQYCPRYLLERRARTAEAGGVE